MKSQANMITAQRRDNPQENSGIAIHGCRVRPAWEFAGVKGSFRNYLGRRWRKYSRTVFLKTDLDGLIDPKGWTEWRGQVQQQRRVKGPGFHLLNSPQQVSPSKVGNFIQGQNWIPVTAVPFWPGI